MHFAGLKPVGESVDKPIEYRDGGVCATPQLLTAARRADVNTVVLSSPATACGDPASVRIRVALLRTAFEKQQDQAVHTTSTRPLAVHDGFIASLVAAIAVTRACEQWHLAKATFSPAAIPILPSHPWFEKFTVADVDTLILLGT